MNQTALITGGAKRIGRAISIELAKKGYNIALHYNTSETEAKATRDEIIALGVKCRIYKCDLTNTSKTIGLIPEIINDLEGLSLLVNNASIFHDINFLEVTPEFFEKDFNINFKAPFFLSQTFTNNVSYGHIINLLDTRVNRTATQHFVYNLSKKLLFHFTKMAAKELAPNIKVNGICPGPILPPEGEDDKYLKNIVKLVPLKTVGSVEVILKAVNYLLENNFVTGECLYVDGGKHLNY